MADYVYLVQMDIPAEMEDEFNRVYDEEHVPNILKAPGVQGCHRYRLESSNAEGMARYAAGVGEGADVSASRGSHGASEGAFAPRGPAPGAAPWASDDDVDGAPPLTLLEEEDERTRSPARGDGRASAAGARSDAIHPQTLSIHDATANARRGGDRGVY